jgi:adenylosuccinate lyase
LKQKIDKQCPNLKGLQEWIHFGLTSQDINNTSIPLSLREAMEHEYYKNFNTLVTQFETMVRDWSEVPMLARTHGQPATPTRVGKEINVFLDRVRGQITLLKQVLDTLYR